MKKNKGKTKRDQPSKEYREIKKALNELRKAF